MLSLTRQRQLYRYFRMIIRPSLPYKLASSWYHNNYTDNIRTPSSKVLKTLFTRGASGLLVVCFLFLPFILSTQSQAKNSHKAEKQRIEKNIRRYRINIRKLQQGIAGQQQKIDSSEQIKRNLLQELVQINSRLQEKLDKQRELEKQMADQQSLIDQEKAKLQNFINDKQDVQRLLQNRIKSYYMMGKIGAANVLFSTENLPQMLQFRESFVNLIAYDRHIVSEFQKAINKLQRVNTALELEKGVLNDFITLAKQEQTAANSIKKEKEALLTQIRTQKRLHEQAVKEMKKATDDFTRSLKALKKKSKKLDHAFRLDKGKHPAPLPGKVIGLFGQNRKNKLGIKSKPTGITIATTGNNKVHAIFDGKVTLATYRKGYGNTVIIDHGFKYSSVVSRLEKILIKKGATVKQGDVIGLTGDTATLMEEGIFFEIKHGKKYLDPLKWISPKKLTLP